MTTKKSTKSPKTSAKPQSAISHSAKNSEIAKQSAAHSAKITLPTIITIIRMFLAVLAFILVLIPTFPTRLLALIVFILGAISDHVDGRLARKHQTVTDLGAFLDPLADKMLTSLAFLALVAMDVVPIWVFAIILVRDFAVDGMRMMAARSGITIAASWLGKWKTGFQLAALIILLANLLINSPFLTIVGNLVLLIALFLTVYSGLDYLIKNWRKVIH